AKRADLRSGFVGAAQQMLSAERRFGGSIIVFDAMPAARRAKVFTQQLSCLWIEQTDLPGIPLHPHASADPSRRRAVVCRLDFYAAIQMDTALAVLVVAKGHDGQPQQGWPLLGEHDRDLPLGGAVNACIGPTFFPAIEIGLSLFDGFEAEPFQRCFLSVADAAFHLRRASTCLRH